MGYCLIGIEKANSDYYKKMRDIDSDYWEKMYRLECEKSTIYKEIADKCIEHLQKNGIDLSTGEKIIDG